MSNPIRWLRAYVAIVRYVLWLERWRDAWMWVGRLRWLESVGKYEQFKRGAMEAMK